MSSLIYKTLFEVKLMHEFYVTEKDGTVVFQLADQKDRINFLLSQYAIDRESVNKDVAFKFPEEFKSKYDGYYLKLLPTYSGCKVALQVKQIILPDNSLVYKPFIPLPDDLNIHIQIDRKNNAIDAYTNKLISTAVPSMYLFSNENLLSSKTFPFLTANVSAFDAGKFYEQGELASFGINDIRENYKNDAGDQWEAVTGKGFANENDALLVPLKFYYSFINVNNITEAEFVLKDKDGVMIKTISITSADALQKVLLDFSDKGDVLSVMEDLSFSRVIFSLEVTGNGGYAKNHKVIFSDVLYNKACWGIVTIKPKPANSLFNLLANDGFLVKRRSPAGIWEDPRVFEIPIKSRFTYWRYINDKGRELKLIPDLTDYLFKEDKLLMSKKPRAISRSYFLLQKEGSSDTRYVPNPITYELKKDSKQRLCFDIMVSESELFPIV